MKIVRKLTFGCVSSIVFALFPTFSYGVSLGNIQLHSHLNESLNAEIQLADANSTALDQIKIVGATSEIYAKAGLRPPPWLSSIDFEVSKNKLTGDIIVNLKTKKRVKEPFADLLLELVWPGGKLVKEYTLLFDPATATSDKIAYSPYDAHTHENPHSGWIRFGARYTPSESDTLWSIAKKLVENTSFTVYQGVATIARKNPHAFKDGNIHSLSEGITLQLPTKAEISRISEAKAQQFVESHGKDWRERGAAKPQPLEEAPKKSQRRIDRVQETETPQISQKLAQIEETLDTLKRSNAEAERKNKNLETQNNALTTLLWAKEEEIKQLRTDDLNPPAPENRLKDRKDYAIAVPDNTQKQIAPAPQITAPAPTQEQPPAANITPEEVDDTEAEPVKAAETEEEKSTESTDTGRTYWTQLALLALLGGLGFAFYRNRKVSKTKPPIIAAEPEPTPAEQNNHYGEEINLDQTVSAIQTHESNTIKSEPAISAEQYATEIAQALEEVDIDIAYEKYVPAEEKLEAILLDHPNQWDAILKLLELYVITQKYNQFEKYCKTLPIELKELAPLIYSKIESLKDKIENENASRFQGDLAHSALVKSEMTKPQEEALPQAIVEELPTITWEAELESQAQEQASHAPLDMQMPSTPITMSMPQSQSQIQPQPESEPEFIDLSKDYALALEEAEPPAPASYSLEDMVPATEWTPITIPTESTPAVSMEDAIKDPASQIFLAETYIDMGEMEMAKKILEQVIPVAPPELKQQAQWLLDKME